MRGIAAARAQQARNQLTAVEGFSTTVATAIARVSALVSFGPPAKPGKPVRLALVLFFAEQGFAGAFSEHTLDAVGSDLKSAQLFLIGTRGTTVAAERGVTGVWQGAMPSHSAGIPRLADRIAEAIYARLATGEIEQLDVVFSRWQLGHGTQIERRHLFPLDTTHFPPTGDSNSPLLNMMPNTLLGELTADYVHAQLCAAALHAFAAENEARMEAMASARNEIERHLTGLQALQRVVRQEEITAEIVELAAGEAASRMNF